MAAQSISYESVSVPTKVETLSNGKIASTLKQIGQRRDYQMIDPRKIDIEPGFNARDYTLPENRAHLDRLKVLLQESERVEKPIIVRLNRETGRATVVDGECRLRAVLELIAEGVEPFTIADMPCYPAPPGSDDLITRSFASLNANEGKPLSKWELGKKYQELYDLNVSIEYIAKKTANTITFVNEAIELANAPEEVKQLLSDAAVTPAEVKRILRSEDIPAEVSALQAAVAEKKARGEKGPVKRPKAKAAQSQSVQAAPVDGEAFDPTLDTPVTLEYESPVPHPVSRKHKDEKSDAYKVEQFVKLLTNLLADVDIADMSNDELEKISVSRKKLLWMCEAIDLLTISSTPASEVTPGQEPVG